MLQITWAVYVEGIWYTISFMRCIINLNICHAYHTGLPRWPVMILTHLDTMLHWPSLSPVLIPQDTYHASLAYLDG